MTFSTILRFVAVIAILAMMGWVWPDWTISFPDILVLAVILSLLDWLMSIIAGRTVSAQYPGWVGWMAGVAILYAAQWVLPGMTLSPGAALTAGSTLWLIGRAFPAVWG